MSSFNKGKVKNVTFISKAGILIQNNIGLMATDSNMALTTVYILSNNNSISFCTLN